MLSSEPPSSRATRSRAPALFVAHPGATRWGLVPALLLSLFIISWGALGTAGSVLPLLIYVGALVGQFIRPTLFGWAMAVAPWWAYIAASRWHVHRLSAEFGRPVPLWGSDLVLLFLVGCAAALCYPDKIGRGGVPLVLWALSFLALAGAVWAVLFFTLLRGLL